MTDILIDPLALVFLLSLPGCVLALAGRRGGKIAALTLGLWLVATLALLLAAAPALVNRALGWQEARDTSLECDRRARVEPGSTLVVLSGGVASRARTAEDYQELYQPGFARLIGAYQWLDGIASPPSGAAATTDNPVEPLIIVAGGGKRQTVPEAEVMRAFLLQLGVADRQVVMESDSVNTQGSAIAVATLLRQRELPLRIELMTSALHMPRAARAFAAAFATEAGAGKVAVATHPAHAAVSLCTRKVDRQAVPDVPWHYLLPQTSALVKFDRLLHEWVGELYAQLRRARTG